MRVDLFDFDLPAELIALRPAKPRDSARLLLVEGEDVSNADAVRNAATLKRLVEERIQPARKREGGATASGSTVRADDAGQGASRNAIALSIAGRSSGRRLARPPACGP